MKSIALLATGAIVGVILVFSCGDDHPSSVDAGTQCECPDAEPPLKTRLVTRTASSIAPAMSYGTPGITCGAGEVVVSGGCLAGVADSRHVLLSSSVAPFESPVGWGCVFYNGTNAPVSSTAHILCLKSAP